MEEEEEEKMSVNHYDLYRLEEEEKSNKYHLPSPFQAVEFTGMRKRPLTTGLKG